jgi:hypothetical protein
LPCKPCLNHMKCNPDLFSKKKWHEEPQCRLPSGGREDVAGGRRGRVQRSTGRGVKLHVLMHAERPATHQRIGTRAHPDGPRRRTTHPVRTRAPAMDDMGVESQRELMTAAPAAGPGTGSRPPGGGGWKHLSSIANHVLRQCSLCVRCSSSRSYSFAVISDQRQS